MRVGLPEQVEAECQKLGLKVFGHEALVRLIGEFLYPDLFERRRRKGERVGFASDEVLESAGLVVVVFLIGRANC